MCHNTIKQQIRLNKMKTCDAYQIIKWNAAFSIRSQNWAGLKKNNHDCPAAKHSLIHSFATPCIIDAK